MRRRISLGLVLILTCAAAQAAFAAPDPQSTFQQLWERSDRPVAEQRAGRSWTWGPAPISGLLYEDFSPDPQPPLPDGRRAVQYFDKGRMEINAPDADSSSPWYVTSGLLPIELITGRKQVGFTSFAPWRESYLSAVGDPGSFPAYPDLITLYKSPGDTPASAIGKPATDLLNQDLSIGSFTDQASDPATTLVAGMNQYGVPRAFIDFQQQQGLFYRNGQLTSGAIYDPLFIFGLPITPAVWVHAQVGGQPQPILFQVFERRVLTYNPANPPDFRVEMGNVGQHYYRWQTDNDAAREWEAVDLNLRTFSARTDPNVIYTLEVNRSDKTDQPGPPIRQANYRLYASQDGGATRELRQSGSLGPGCWTVLNVALLQPHNPQAAPGRVGLMTQCADNPSAGRGFGITFLTSYDGGRTMLTRGGA